MGCHNVSIRMLVATSILKEDWFRHRLLISYCCICMNICRLALFLTTINQRPLPESVSSFMDKTRNSIYRLMEAIVGSIKVLRKYLTFLAEISVLSASKLRFYVSEQMFIETSRVKVDSVILLLKFRPWKKIPESHPAFCLVQLFKR